MYEHHDYRAQIQSQRQLPRLCRTENEENSAYFRGRGGRQDNRHGGEGMADGGNNR